MGETQADCDILIVGAGVGGCAAAMAACSLGLRVILTEECAWIGGQLTSQAVPPDEHRWIEQLGCTSRYRRYRELVRAFYREQMPLREEARKQEFLNPGGGWVSRLCHEPKIGWFVLNEMLAPYFKEGLLDLRLKRKAASGMVQGDKISALSFVNQENGQTETVYARYVLDATELGDLLPLAGAEYVVGSEAKAQTGEPHASDEADPQNVQGLTWVMALGYDPEGEYYIEKPAQYEKWRDFTPSFWPGPLLGWDVTHALTGQPARYCLFPDAEGKGISMFSYRQIVDPAIFSGEGPKYPVTLVNWPMNDYFEGSILDVPTELSKRRLESARQLSLSLLYWLQTEAPRHDKGYGYPGLYLSPDVVGTQDGFAQYPYIRESRRIKARFTVLEQYVSAECHPNQTLAQEFSDSVGIGSYRLDLHPSTGGDGILDLATLPFQIPLGSLIPIRLRNLLPACKNIGTTHITNGCYRLHPIEWNIGEAAALLAGFCLKQGFEPAQVYESQQKIADFQRLLISQGIELAWPLSLA